MLQSPDRPVVVTHWGTYHAEMQDGRPVALSPIAEDPDPSPIADGMIDALTAPARIERAAIRASFLAAREAGRVETDGKGRGFEPFVEVPFDEALDLAAGEIDRVRREHGNGAIYGGSYGWASAGRFHHAQSQIHRFLNSVGGYVRSIQNYSYAAADTIVPHVVGDKRGLVSAHTSWPRIAAHTETLIMFGGVPWKNAQVSSGGIARHILDENLSALRQRGARLVSVSPIRDDTAGDGVEWVPIRPGTDTALMLALAHVLIAEGRVATGFLDRCTVGFETLAAYVTGTDGSVAKTPQWAEGITGVPANTIRDLALAAASSRAFLMVAWSLQRAESGEQPYWMAIALAAMLGQIGLAGGGFGFGYASVNGIGNPVPKLSFPSLPQLDNPVADYIPVARIADALLHPGEPYAFNGMDRRYPDLRLVYWAGGNPFHHHQDLNRLRRAWQKPGAVIVNDSWWNPLARHADIVFPTTTTLERNDLAASSRDRFVAASHKVAEPAGEARDDYAIFSALAARLGAADAFTEGRDVEAWLRHLYEAGRDKAAAADIPLPDFETFWRDGLVMLPAPALEDQGDLLAEFRAAPETAGLATPSGRIELFSERIAGFGYDDCPGHPAWLPPREWLGAQAAATYPLHLISNQPKTRLHSQYDLGSHSRAAKRHDREVMRMHAKDAAARGIAEGSVVRVFNDRGGCLAAVELSDDILPGVVQLSTGAWYDPADDGSDRPLDRHGNPNVLTADHGTSRLSQGPSAQSCLVEVEPYRDALPPVRAFDPPAFARRGRD
ncbi:biotin/methionine sulfoxide reductase [Rhodobium orientis]|uniref:Asp-tRNA(Asn)/Glu-tRNA(Gln) amidotransferase GatCAB subunit C n=1 Tax=Rhodobium orientis TaxID=34017 RepID=A0A327JUC3_9HYPH|nr:molybdopterin-dependent oxidoreductase [Rhodobium orientis]MBB4302804.1 biotin/methionine sulfoxide reductase [Rhodobium orientis]MBK5948584.1 aspartyl/glutamyl-tRNA(Asn/Gln) amidotransferase subunit C [Rhodobium orientis]RAI29847.1 Asp-tRNA(Asn)/Glu-tRNA(Gln) amidotransferase GatCAB subunit C [Rhodobium orientis]